MIAVFNRQGPVLLLIALLAVLSGCGFQLRGAIAIPDELKVLHLAGDKNTAIYQAVAQILQSNEVELVDSPDQAPYQIKIVGEKLSRRSASLNTRAKIEEYELRTTLTYSISDSEGNELIEPTAIFTERTYSYDENNVNATTAEESLLRQEMRENLAAQLVRRYLKLAETQAP
ncbi:MAG: LPS assembly lipoprotein LptE [Motiliproteus sp.]